MCVPIDDEDPAVRGNGEHVAVRNRVAAPCGQQPALLRQLDDRRPAFVDERILAQKHENMTS
jgi:hypothetical protein